MTPLQWYKSDGIFWFRIFGYGLVVKRLKKHPMTFSERNGYVTYIKLFGLLIKPLYT